MFGISIIVWASNIIHLLGKKVNGHRVGQMTLPRPTLSPINRFVDAVVHQTYEEGAIGGIVQRDGQGEH